MWKILAHIFHLNYINSIKQLIMVKDLNYLLVCSLTNGGPSDWLRLNGLHVSSPSLYQQHTHTTSINVLNVFVRIIHSHTHIHTNLIRRIRSRDALRSACVSCVWCGNLMMIFVVAMRAPRAHQRYHHSTCTARAGWELIHQTSVCAWRTRVHRAGGVDTQNDT